MKVASIAWWICFSLCFSLAAQAQIKANIKASQITGTAPLVVFFDASETTYADNGLDAFHDLHYQWNFGDIHSGIWDFKPKSKNTAEGPITAHVFDSVGLHIVELEVKDCFGHSDIAVVIVKVEASYKTYEKERTICFSTKGDFADAPYQAKMVTIDSLSDITPYLKSDYRLLFRRGDTIQTSKGIRLEGVENVTIGAYGPCLSMNNRRMCINAPTIIITGESENAIDIIHSKDSNVVSNIVVMDLNIISKNSKKSGYGIYTEGFTECNLFYRLHLSGFRSAVLYDNIFSDDPSKNILPSKITYADCIFEKKGNESVGYISAANLALLGNDWKNDGDNGHVLTLSGIRKGVMCYNRLFNPANLKNCLYMTLPIKLDTNITLIRPTEKVVISDNHFEAKEHVSELVVVEKYGGVGVIEDIIFDKNFVNAGENKAAKYGIIVEAESITLRNNIINATGADRKAFTGIFIKNNQYTPNTHKINISNNTIYKADFVSMFTGIKVSAAVEAAYITNNLVYSPMAMDIKILDLYSKDVYQRRNIYPIVHPFIAEKPVTAFDFQLDSISLSLERGVHQNYTYKDYLGNRRFGTSAIYVGAFQYSSTPITILDFNQLSSSSIHEYPNPIRSYFTLDLSNITSTYDVEILDYQGEIIFSEYQKEDRFYLWETQYYDNGVYWIKVSSKEATFLTKVMISR